MGQLERRIQVNVERARRRGETVLAYDDGKIRFPFFRQDDHRTYP